MHLKPWIPFQFVCLLASNAAAQGFTVEQVVAGFTSPVAMATAPGEVDRLFVLEKDGLIRLASHGAIHLEPFLDLVDVVAVGAKGGLLAMAFHPEFADNGRVFVSYPNLAGETVLEEYFVPSGANVADPDPVQTIVAFPNGGVGSHLGGCLQFSPDGYLYMSVGDGMEVLSAQDRLDLRGSLLRFDVDLPPFFIPPSNPYVGNPDAHDAIWANGFRQPWRFSFDCQTGDLWLGDVGHITREEVDYQPADSLGGENYGWPCMEGSFCTPNGGCTCFDSAHVLPLFEYDHGPSSTALIGGYVYRGSAIPELQGAYVFGDFATGALWSIRLVGGQATDFQVLTGIQEPPLVIAHVNSFGVDGMGELYVVDPGQTQGSIGRIWKFVPRVCEVASYCVTSPNSTTPGSIIGAMGSTSLSAAEFRLIANQATPDQFGIFFYGAQPNMFPFGDGFLCIAQVGLGIVRFDDIVILDAAGEIVYPVDFTAPPAGSGASQITPGSTWRFQFWYRDPAGPGGSGFNLSNGLEVTFCP